LFVSDRMPYLVLRGDWCGVIVLNALKLTEVKMMTQRTVL